MARIERSVNCSADCAAFVDLRVSTHVRVLCFAAVEAKRVRRHEDPEDPVAGLLTRKGEILAAILMSPGPQIS